MEMNNIDLREEYYKDIHSMKPKWWMRWGILTVFILLAILLTLGYVVKYPDVIRAEFTLTTNKPSVTLPIAQGQQIHRLLKVNKDKVETNEPIIVLESDADYKDVLLLEQELQQLSFAKDSLLGFFDSYLEKNLRLGSTIESNWISFSNELLAYYKIVKLESHQAQISFLQQEVQKQQQLKKEYEQLIKQDNQQRFLIQEKQKTDSILYAKGVISRITYNSNKRNYLESIKGLQQNSVALKRINLEIVRLTNAMANQGNNEIENLLTRKLGIRKSLNKLQSSIASWKRRNLLVSPITGKINYIQDIKQGRFYEGNVIVIIPEDNTYYASLQIPFIGAGKIEEQQKAILKLNDYPYREYGVIQGKITALNPVAGEQFYLGKVAVQENKLSSHKKEIALQENMTGICEIITKDRSMLQRVFEKITYAFTR